MRSLAVWLCYFFCDFFFFFQAEDGIRDLTVTGVQTCALPILPGDRAKRGCSRGADTAAQPRDRGGAEPGDHNQVRAADAGNHTPLAGADVEIGRASCRERV